ncbi:MAG: hypothetical protein MUP45_01875 [Candidatus Marinimicrobia bacterium]|nr:hypothetical protein [Candidatus Neomarinimicrobiota bacterium]
MAQDTGQEQTDEEKRQQEWDERNKKAGSTTAFIKAGAISSSDLERASEQHPAFMESGWGLDLS